MSYTSIINMIDKNKKRTTYQPRKRNIKNTALYDNQLARSFVKISRATPNQCLRIGYEAFDEIRALEFMNKMTTEDYRERRLRIKNMKAFSLEAASYLYSLEEENKSTNWFKKVLEFFKNIWKKFIEAVASFARWVVNQIKLFLARFSNGIYKKFQESQFTNMSAKIKVTPVPEIDIAGSVAFADYGNKKIKDIRNDWIEKLRKADEVFEKLTAGCQKMGDQETIDNINALFKPFDDMLLTVDNTLQLKEAQNPKEIVYEELYGNKVKPKKIETTVGEFLKCKAGERPPALELISEKSLKTLQMGYKEQFVVIKMLKNGFNCLNVWEKIVKRFEDDVIKHKGEAIKAHTIFPRVNTGMNKIKNLFGAAITMNHVTLSEVLNIRADIAKAVSVGLKGGGSATATPNNEAPATETPAGE